MKIIFILIFIAIITVSCHTRKLISNEQKYSTGHLGMPGEYIFIIKKGDKFCYYESAGYSEGTFVRVGENRIKLTTKVIETSDTCEKRGLFLDLSNKELVFKGNKLLYYRLVLSKVK